jgi:AcrR family transcriptional regulator
VEQARGLIASGEGDLTMRRLADHLGIQAPSLYKHFPDKGAIERAVYVDYLVALRDALVAARLADVPAHPVERVAMAYRAHAMANRAIYLYVHELPYPRAEAADLLKDNRRQWFLAAGDRDLAIAVYAFMRGMVELELHDLYPIASTPSEGLRQGLAALIARAETLAQDRTAVR